MFRETSKREGRKEPREREFRRVGDGSLESRREHEFSYLRGDASQKCNRWCGATRCNYWGNSRHAEFDTDQPVRRRYAVPLHENNPSVPRGRERTVVLPSPHPPLRWKEARLKFQPDTSFSLSLSLPLSLHSVQKASVSVKCLDVYLSGSHPLLGFVAGHGSISSPNLESFAAILATMLSMYLFCIETLGYWFVGGLA